MLDKVLVFDVDDTLYPYDVRRDQMEDILINKYFQHKLNIDEAKSAALIKVIRSKYHFDVDAMEKDFPFSKHDFMEQVCRVDMSFLQPNPELDLLLKKLPQRKIIFSDNIANQIIDVLNLLKIDINNFSDICDSHTMNYTFKYNSQAFEIFFSKYCLNPSDCIMFEDSIKNLDIAKKFGMTTVFISTQNDVNTDVFDYKFKDINTALKKLFF